MEQIFKALTSLIKEYDNIIIMTHKNPDFDGMGSALVLQQIIMSFKKTSYILKNNRDKTLAKAYKYLDEKNIKTNFITKKELLKIINKETLVIILDTHKEQMLEENIIDKIENIVIIDHHIKSKDYIKTNNLTYINANLSSTVEFMADYLKYLNKTIEPLLATYMMIGLEIDTNSFKLKTTDKTYEAAAYLTRLGSDNVIKQEMLQETKDNYLKRQKIVEKSFMINKNMAMCIADNNFFKAQDLAVIALELIQFENVEASFVVGNLSATEVGISARSIGTIDVEQIMVKLGGGGHINEAAAQLKNVSLLETKEKIIAIVGGLK
ncbi:MAG: DHH family phosphoesterase [Bacilli bacterium]